MYKVIDDMCCQTHEVEDLKEAKQLAFDVQGTLLNSEGKILLDFS